MSKEILMGIVVGIGLDIIVKVWIMPLKESNPEAYNSYFGPIKSQNDFGWRVLVWIVPLSYLGILTYVIRKKIKQITDWWKNLPAR